MVIRKGNTATERSAARQSFYPAHQRKKAIPQDGLFTYLMSGSSLVPHGAELTATGLTRSFNLMPGNSLVPHGAGLTATGLTRSFNLMPGSSLLSHGESPHYHRRYGVSLLSSAWGQVGPPRYGRQANSLCSVLCLLRSYCVGCSCEPQSHTYVCSFRRCVCRLVSAQNPSDSLICI
jgi:hypothetical protein